MAEYSKYVDESLYVCVLLQCRFDISVRLTNPSAVFLLVINCKYNIISLSPDSTSTTCKKYVNLKVSGEGVLLCQLLLEVLEPNITQD